MKNDKKIYILMATYNGEKFIAEQLDSIIIQTYQNWELIIHDDGSDDETINIIKKYVKEYPNKIHLLDDGIRCGGAFENFNYLLQSIDNDFDYLMFSDQDDIWFQSRVEDFYYEIQKQESLSSNIPIVVFSDAIIVDETLKTIHPSLLFYTQRHPRIATSYHWLAIGNIISGFSMILNKQAFNSSLPLPNKEFPHDWWISLVAAKEGRIFFLPKRTAYYRRHNNNVIDVKAIKEPPYWIAIVKIIYYSPYIIKTYFKSKQRMSYLNVKISFGEFLQLYISRMKLCLSMRKSKWLDFAKVLKDIYTH